MEQGSAHSVDQEQNLQIIFNTVGNVMLPLLNINIQMH